MNIEGSRERPGSLVPTEGGCPGTQKDEFWDKFKEEVKGSLETYVFYSQLPRKART